MDKSKVVKEFMHDLLANGEKLDALMGDRIPSEVLIELNNYSKFVVDNCASLQKKPNLRILFCTFLVLGFLLKSELDRVELNEIFKE